MSLNIDPTFAIFNTNVNAATPSIHGGLEQHATNKANTSLRSIVHDEISQSSRPNLPTASLQQSQQILAPPESQEPYDQPNGESNTGRFRKAGIEVYQASKAPEPCPKNG